jgi:hypothetical protein
MTSVIGQHKRSLAYNSDIRSVYGDAPFPTVRLMALARDPTSLGYTSQCLRLCTKHQVCRSMAIIDWVELHVNLYLSSGHPTHSKMRLIQGAHGSLTYLIDGLDVVHLFIQTLIGNRSSMDRRTTVSSTPKGQHERLFECDVPNRFSQHHRNRWLV